MVIPLAGTWLAKTLDRFETPHLFKTTNEEGLTMYRFKLKPKGISFLLFLAIVLLLAGHGEGEAQTDPDFNPELAGALQATLDRSREATGIIGATMAVIIPNEGMWVGASGLSDRDAGTPMRPENLFRIASITKTFTAALVLQLVAEGKLTLEDSIAQWLPNLVPNGEDITLRHLLNHTSGIFNITDNDEFEASLVTDFNKIWQPKEVVNLATAQPPQFAPGAGLSYSHTGYILLGMIVEAATSSTLEGEVRRRFLQPLQLDNTFFDGSEKTKGELAHGYTTFMNLDDMTQIPHTALATAAWAAGGMVSNAENLAQWAEALYGGRVLDAASLDQMLTFIDPGVGLGVFRVQTPMGFAVGHTGLIRGYASTIFYLPDHSMAVAMLINQDFDIAVRGEGLILFPVILDAALAEISELGAISTPTAVNAAGKLATTWGKIKTPGKRD
jgi:D-alanyl-D-alanine carboxypeptidase